ncbi:unnamed protein product, partial [marine sediment metagenome]
FERLELTIDSERLPSGGSLTLAKGLHEIEIDVDFGHGSLFRLLWREPSRDLEVIPPRFLFRPKAAPHGLFGRFFSGPHVVGAASAGKNRPTALVLLPYHAAAATLHCGVERHAPGA